MTYAEFLAPGERVVTWHTCPRCGRELYPHTARRTDNGWVCANVGLCHSTALAHARRDARIEDVRWMADTGETLSGAARRLGLSVDAFERWLQRNAPELRRPLARREPMVAA